MSFGTRNAIHFINKYLAASKSKPLHLLAPHRKTHRSLSIHQVKPKKAKALEPLELVAACQCWLDAQRAEANAVPPEPEALPAQPEVEEAAPGSPNAGLVVSR